MCRGGMMAEGLAVGRPDRVRWVGLGGAFASFRRVQRAPLRSAWDLLALNLGFKPAERVARLLVSAEWDARNPGGALKWIRGSEPAGFRYALAQFLAVVRHDTLNRLSQIRAPPLVLNGGAHRLLPLANSGILAKAVPGAPPDPRQSAGHAFPLEREEET